MLEKIKMMAVYRDGQMWLEEPSAYQGNEVYTDIEQKPKRYRVNDPFLIVGQFVDLDDYWPLTEHGGNQVLYPKAGFGSGRIDTSYVKTDAINIQDILQPDFSAIQKFADDNFDWQKTTFPNGTAVSSMHHLCKEAIEIIEGIETGHSREEIVGEYADVLILLLCSMGHFGLKFKDLFVAAQKKMQINRGRKWGKPDANGVVEHVRDEKVVAEPCPECNSFCDPQEIEMFDTCLECFSRFGKKK